MVQTVLHVLLECFVKLSERMEKYAQTVGHCVSVIMALFELMMPLHYHVLRNSLQQGTIPGIDLEVSSTCIFSLWDSPSVPAIQIR